MVNKQKAVEYHIADDGTIVEKKDWDWLQKHMKKQRIARKTQTKRRRPIRK